MLFLTVKSCYNEHVKIGLYDPYLDTLGGGERYILSIASLLAKEHDVSVFWNDHEILKKASQRFNLDLSQVKIVPNIFLKKSSLINTFSKTRNFDRFLYVSDGSVPFLFAKKNFLLFQFPTLWVKGKSIQNKLKLSNIDTILCYSEFVKKYLEQTFEKKITVLAPPAGITSSQKIKKENIIVTVGRFTKSVNTKKQEEMIIAFKKLLSGGLKNWKFILAGGVLAEDEEFVADLKRIIKGYPIELYENIQYQQLVKLYQKSKIYWHATGFEENLILHPERAEHFGITTIEAMSQGVVPVVINAGGQKEIVENGENGYTWDTEKELVEQTKKLISDKHLWEKLSENAKKRAKTFSLENFSEKVKELFA